MSVVKSSKLEKAAARLRKTEEEKRAAAAREKSQKLELFRLCGEALFDAATGGKEYGEFLMKPVAELVVHLGIVSPDDIESMIGESGDSKDDESKDDESKDSGDSEDGDSEDSEDSEKSDGSEDSEKSEDGGSNESVDSGFNHDDPYGFS